MPWGVGCLFVDLILRSGVVRRRTIPTWTCRRTRIGERRHRKPRRKPDGYTIINVALPSTSPELRPDANHTYTASLSDGAKKLPPPKGDEGAFSLCPHIPHKSTGKRDDDYGPLYGLLRGETPTTRTSLSQVVFVAPAPSQKVGFPLTAPRRCLAQGTP